MTRPALAALLLFLAADASAGAGSFWAPYPARDPCDMARAGYANRVAPWAHPTYDSTYRGYYVGGGALAHGEPRRRGEGTWGVDYDPWFTRVRLRWHHGRRLQGGEGQYEPDGKVGGFHP